MQKEIVTKVEDANKLISDKFSVMKTTCKAFLAFYKELASIQQNYADQLLKLTKTTGKHFGMKKSLAECKEIENPTIRALIDNQLGFLLGMSDINSQVAQQITQKLIPEINDIYLNCKQMKHDIMKVIQNEIKKPFNTYNDKMKKLQSSITSSQKKLENPSRLLELQKENEQILKEISSFGTESAKQMLKFVDQSTERETKRNIQLKTCIQLFGNITHKQYESASILSKKIAESYEKMTLEPDLSDFNQMSSSLKIAAGITTSDGLVNKNSKINIEQENRNEINKQVQSTQPQNQLQLKKEQIDSELKQSRIRKNKIKYDTVQSQSIPLIIKEQLGIFHNNIPENEEFCKRFQLSQFGILICSLARIFLQNESAKDQEQAEEIEVFISYIKNKFKISLKDYKMITKFFGKRQQNLQEQNNYLSCLLKECTDLIKNNNLLDDEVRFLVLFTQHLYAFIGINQYWNNILIPRAYYQQPNPKLELTYKNNLESIHAIFSQQNPSREDLIKYSSLNIFLEPQITFPLNQSLTQMMIQTLVENQLLQEYWEENLNWIIKFGQEGLNMNAQNIQLTFIKYYYENILHSSLVRKEKESLKYLLNLERVLEQTQEILLKEQNLTPKNESANQKLLSYLNQSIKFTLSYKPFLDFLDIIKNFWNYFYPQENQIKAACHLLYILAVSQKDYTIYSDLEELFIYIFSSAGLKYCTNFYKKIKFNPQDPIDKETLPKIQDVLANNNREGLIVISSYIPLFAKHMHRFIDYRQNELKIEFVNNYIENLLSEIIKILELVVEHNMLNNDNSSFAFTIAFEISKLDDILNKYNPERATQYYQLLTPFIDYWFNNLEFQCKNMLQNCLKQENWQTGEGQKLYTRSVVDYCSLMFKSIEVMNQLVNAPETNRFRKQIVKKFEILVYEALNDYSKEVLNSLNYINSIEETQFKKLSTSKLNPQMYPNNTENEIISNLKEFKAICYRFGNMQFLHEQIDTVAQDLLQFSSDILNGLKKEFDQNIQKISKLAAMKLVRNYMRKPVFNQILMNFDANQFSMLSVEEFSKQYKGSIKNLLDEVDDFFQLFSKRVPKQHQEILAVAFASQFTKEYIFAVMDVNKYVFDIDSSRFSQYFKYETNYIKTYLSSKMPMGVNIQLGLAENISILMQIASYLDESVNDLLSNFEQAMVQNDEFRCSILFRLLYIRRNENNKKQIEIIKKYKKYYLGV
ncbi:hypothetical protein TTHERM_00354700 (macronuclear) [Tetrahymena thermophila SB210]|uniref:Uncharacterized protein n=1 Tax=Tetrahymena thermophila (strain SB210) TaxID=312017 RepID=Q22YA1_TETTS|nr:hypothetical protein TTHERM_00354700 [Tetrahymena thermophila SB210]EAR90123.3 hypothetical protein TTHERM_00354700 [Tetrahymena thermophila SB210]|eukprot:XP_001010368.3 hypothetical protein TTHERM_00354700 [Tetrahymena thermophila SB210]